MRIKFTYYYTKYNNSKLATFLSIIKSGVSGFFTWMGLFLLPLIIGCGIGGSFGNAYIPAIVVGGMFLLSYLFILIFVDPDAIADRKDKKTRHKQNVSDANADNDCDILEFDLKTKLIVECWLKVVSFFSEHSLDYLLNDVKDRVIADINNDLRVFEAIFGSEIYSSNDPKIVNLLSTLPTKSVSLSIYYAFSLNKYFNNIRVGEVLSVIENIIINQNDIIEMKNIKNHNGNIGSYLLKRVDEEFKNRGVE